MNEVTLPKEIFKERAVPRHPLSGEPNITEISIAFPGLGPISLKGVLGQAEEPHILYFPAEFDEDIDAAYLASGFSLKGGSFFWLPYQDAIPEKDINFFLKLCRKALEDFLTYKEEENRPGPMVLMGRSLGTAPALDAFSKFEDSLLCLILESAFAETEAFFRALGCGELGDFEEPFLNRKKMSVLKKAVLFLHSHGDSIVPIRDVEWLVCESRSKASQFQIVPSSDRWDLSYKGGALYFDTIWQFIGLRMGRRPKRRARRPIHQGS